MLNRNLRYFSNMSKYILSSTSGNFAIMGALILPVLLVAAGGAVDIASAYSTKKDLQERLDAGVLSAAPQGAHSDRQKRVEQFMSLVGVGSIDGTANGAAANSDFVAGSNALKVTTNADGSVTAQYSVGFRPMFLGMIGMSQMPIEVNSTAYAEMKPQNQTCIYALTKDAMGLRINSGVNIQSKNCEIAVHSSGQQDAFFAAADAKVDTAKFCVKGTKFNNHAGANLKNFQSNCAPAVDPYAGKMPMVDASMACTNGNYDKVGTYRLKPGKHCSPVNSASTLIFEPGLHIISGMITISSGATIIAEGVTFYFPDSYSELRVNGSVTSKMIAPTSGPYKGIMMFEKPTAKNANYIFNGSVSEQLEGIIYLPSRDVTFNSKTNQTAKISLVVNSAILNPNSWQIEPYDGGGSGKASVARLVR
jgi:Flp pilus assembly protein TadG